jgi:hypothetical protein
VCYDEYIINERITMTSTDVKGYSIQRLLDEATEDLSADYELVYVDRSDQLDSRGIDALLSGDLESFYDMHSEWESEQQWSGAEYHEKDLVDTVLGRWARADDEFDPDVLRDLWEGSGAQDSLREEIRARDSSDWVRELARNTPAVLFRIRVSDDDFDCDWSSDEPGTPVELLRMARLPETAENLSAAQEIIDNAQTYGVVYYLVALSLDGLVNAPEGATVEIDAVHLLLSNPYAGNGHEAAMAGSVSVPLADLRTDAGQFGYSWMEIAGVYVSAYASEYRVVAPVPERQEVTVR